MRSEYRASTIPPVSGQIPAALDGLPHGVCRQFP